MATYAEWKKNRVDPRSQVKSPRAQLGGGQAAAGSARAVAERKPTPDELRKKYNDMAKANYEGDKAFNEGIPGKHQTRETYKHGVGMPYLSRYGKSADPKTGKFEPIQGSERFYGLPPANLDEAGSEKWRTKNYPWKPTYDPFTDKLMNPRKPGQASLGPMAPTEPGADAQQPAFAAYDVDGEQSAQPGDSYGPRYDVDPFQEGIA